MAATKTPRKRATSSKSSNGESKRKRTEIPEDHACRDADGDVCPFYCPGCGRGLKYEGECYGTNEAPHPAIQTVSTDELTGDPAKHTPAPDSA